MTKQKEVKSALECWFNSQISLTERARVKSLVMERCGITESTFYRRLIDPSKFNQVEREYIAGLAKKPVKRLFA